MSEAGKDFDITDKANKPGGKKAGFILLAIVVALVLAGWWFSQ